MPKFAWLSRKYFFFALKISVTLIIFWALTHNAQLKFQLFITIFSNPYFVFAIISLILLSVFVNAWRWHQLNLAQEIKLPFTRSVIATYIGVAFNNVLPGSVGGDFVRCFYVIKQFPHKKSAAILSTFLDRICGLMGIIVIASLIALYRNDIFQNSALSFLIKFCCCITFMSIFAVCIFMLIPKVFRNWLKRYLLHYQKLKPLMSLLQAIAVYRQSKFIVFQALIAAILMQLILLVIIMLISQMMGLPHVPAYIYMLALALGQIANLIPLTPGGIGIGEAAFANVILILNPAAAGAYATVFFAFRLFITLAYLPGVIWGIFGFNLRSIDNSTILDKTYEPN